MSRHYFKETLEKVIDVRMTIPLNERCICYISHCDFSPFFYLGSSLQHTMAKIGFRVMDVRLKGNTR